MKIIVIFGGASVEHDVSILTGLQATSILSEEMEIFPVYLSLDNKFYLTDKKRPTDFFDKQKLIKNSEEITFFNGAIYKKKKDKLIKYKEFDYALNCCHGGVGENGQLKAYFDLNNVKCSSANTLASEICMNKFLTKIVLQNMDIPVVDGVLVTKENLQEKIEIINKKLKDNLIIKPNSLGSSIGVKKSNKNDLKNDIVNALQLDREILVENCVENMVELNCGAYKKGEEIVLGEIEKVGNKIDVLSFDDKYCSKNSTREIPAKIDKDVEEKICEITKKVYNELNLSGVIRIDFMLEVKSKKLYLNEINTTPGSMAYYLFQGKGITYSMMCEDLFKSVTEEKKQTYFESQILSKTGLKIK